MYERQLWSKGTSFIAGVDEVGRGCLFGDVVAAAVIMPVGLHLEGVKDSKTIREKQREVLYELILSSALAVGIARVDAQTIDRINIREASRLAMKQAVLALQITPDELLIDAESIQLPIKQQSIIHGDALSQSIAAASIVAKVTRDRLCIEWDSQYPVYGLRKHKGYATKVHREQILNYGATSMHRKTFINNLLPQLKEQNMHEST
jgi:ribonuclease HII